MKPAIEHAARLAATDPQAAYDIVASVRTASAESFHDAFERWAVGIFEAIEAVARTRGASRVDEVDVFGLNASTVFQASDSVRYEILLALDAQARAVSMAVIEKGTTARQKQTTMVSFDAPAKRYVTAVLEMLY